MEGLLFRSGVERRTRIWLLASSLLKRTIALSSDGNRAALRIGKYGSWFDTSILTDYLEEAQQLKGLEG